LILGIEASQVTGRTPIDFHPEDSTEADEVFTTPLNGVDQFFQPNAVWSLERTIRELRSTGLPQPLSAAEIAGGHWSFYALRLRDSGRDLVAVRAKSPTFGLTSHNKLVTRLVGNELRLVEEPLISFDRSADVLVVDDWVFVIRPGVVERLFVDADAVKARAPQTATRFRGSLNASLSDATAMAIERICSHNANVARRVERLVADGGLEQVTAPEVRASLPSANLPPEAFGQRGPLRAESDGHAKILIEIAADLYYQPRFSQVPRRVGSYRSLS
jgi:hypothetical protein